MTSTHEQWDIVSGVGITALAVAEGRAAESAREDRLINDPYARALVDAADAPQLASSEAQELMRGLVSDYMGVRTRFFDEFFLRAAAGGCGQAVILASGLDTRAFRLDWPSGLRIFEVDQAKVLEFKDQTLDSIGAKPTAERHAISADLRDDWAGALQEAGFDTSVPTAWLAEGLLPYLPAEAEAQLLETIHAFSAPGSRLSIEHIAGDRSHMVGDEIQQVSEQWGIDLPSLFSIEDRPDPGDVLTGKGWTVRRDPGLEIAAGYGRKFIGFHEKFHEVSQMLTARLES
ncbi:class I SAM-dependent methyltransferase [Saccharopolyspora sp. NFXS83]|uniref:class I SAM-dependent methyltransferase n=1 Tax=Saccharopolyspora sp. NFXS83 TaxID=2993560 RepID=UPI00224AE668|nr:class I SAM-dependent methyltransferase [Saccharopolyspora sp. NFXS83]MCX2729893.1 class I SAM-dependent methyltransferase [Saccharopolyspora sp. NFXS83]